MNQATKEAIDQSSIVAHLKGPMSAESLAKTMGFDNRACKWLVPELHQLKSEGVIKWKNAKGKDTPNGLMHWERVK